MPKSSRGAAPRDASRDVRPDSTSAFGVIDLLLLALVVVWGVNYTVIKAAISGPGAPFTPFAFNAIRFVIAAVILLGVLAFLDKPRVRSRGDLARIFGLGFLGNTLYQILFILGVNRTSVANGSLILASVPVMVALLGVATRTDRPTRLGWVGILLSFAGIAAVVLGSAARGDGAGHAAGESTLFGDILILTAAAVWSAYTALAAPLLARYSSTQVTSMSLAAGTVPLVIMALPDLSRVDWGGVPLSGWGAAVFSGSLALALGYIVWNRGVKHLGGTRTAVFSNMTPIFAALSARIFRDEALTVFHAIGAAAILSGIHLTRAGRRPAAPLLPAEE